MLPHFDAAKVAGIIQPINHTDSIQPRSLTKFLDNHKLAPSLHRAISRLTGCLGIAELEVLFPQTAPLTKPSVDGIRAALFTYLSYLVKLETVRREIVGHKAFVITQAFRRLRPEISYAEFVAKMYTTIIEC